jgi:DNA-binding transcriptional LysR family regulator
LIHSVIPEYQRRYPEVRVDLVTQGEFVDIVADGFDAGVRLREAVPRDMVAVELGGAQHFVPVAAPAYMAGRNMPAAPEDLAAHDCIRFRMPSGRLYRWEFEKDGQARLLEAQGSMTLDDISLMVESAIGGLGVAFVPAAAVKVDIEEGRLISLLPEWCPPFPGWCLYYAGHRHVPPALRALIEVVRNLNESRASQR